jgi:hypothetical protein
LDGLWNTPSFLKPGEWIGRLAGIDSRDAPTARNSVSTVKAAP